VVLTGGNVNDCTQFTAVVAGVEFRRPGPGRPATRVLADNGYSSRAEARSTWHAAPPA
jgi:hypothetical protein